jgi:hypothetical protein
VPQDVYESRGGNAAFYYYDDYTVKASMSLEPYTDGVWPQDKSDRLTGDTWDHDLPALPNWDPAADTYVQQILCVCVCVRSLMVPCSLDAFTLRKYDPKPGQSKSYGSIVEALKDDLPACLGKVDRVLANRCNRGGTTPLWHHTPVTPHHHYPYITAPHHMHMHPLTPPCWQ